MSKHTPVLGRTTTLFTSWFGLCLALSLATGGAQAADEAWFGAPKPEEIGAGRESTESTYSRSGMAPLSLRLPTAEDPYRDIEGEAIHRDMSALCQISEESRLAGDPMWGRICGTPYELKAAQYMESRFREFGLENVRMEKFDRSAQWWPTQWTVTLVGDPAYGSGTKDFVFTSAFPAEPSPATGSEVVEAELVYVGLGRPADLAGRDLKGKIAVVHSAVAYSTFNHSARGTAPRLVEAGAAGVITIMNVPGNLLFKIQGTGSADAPCFTIGGDDGEFLEEVIGRAGDSGRDGPPLRARLQLNVEKKEGWQSQNVLGLIRGSGDEYLVLTAHLDAYFYGASDNASGLATLLALAEHYSRPETPQPRRNLLFIATGGHHARSVGSANIVANYREILEKSPFVFNCEHTAAALVRSADGRTLLTANTESPKQVGITNRSPTLIELMSEALDRYGVVTNSRPTDRAPGDAGHFVRAGYPVVQLIESNYWYHSSGDTPATISARGLERTARAYAHFLDAANERTREELENGSVKR